MAFAIYGTGCRAPHHAVNQRTMAEVAVRLCCDSTRQERLARALYGRSGIKTRGSVLLDETDGQPKHEFYRLREDSKDRGPDTALRMGRFERHAGNLAAGAVEAALEQAGLRPGEITHLITVTCTGFHAPGLDFDLIQRFGLSTSVARTQIGFMGCQAVLNALRVANAVASSDREARVLIASVELCSLHFRYGWDPDAVLSNAIFADGAGAIVGGRPRSAPAEWILVDSAGRMLPDSAEAMTWRIGSHGFDMTLSRRIPELIERHLPGWLEEWLQSRGFSPADVKSWAVHPGGTRILKAARESLGLPPEATEVSRLVLERHGNMSSATLVFILRELMRSGSELPCVALGFGPGLTIEGALFTGEAAR
jgi:predicted naringenin-chalcone synthase